MTIKSTIEFNGNRSVYSNGNIEKWSFTIFSTTCLSEKAVELICSIHGCGGQSFSYQTEKNDKGFTYKGSATCYSD